MAKPNKLTLTDALKSTTMFLISDKIERETEKTVSQMVNVMKKQLIGIETKDGLKNFILSSKESISLLITLLNIAEEKFKRVTSWIRISMGYTFDSEWTAKSAHGKLKSNPQLLDLFCDLFSNGYQLDKFQSIIPKFYLQDFKIDSSIMGRLSNDDYLRNLIKNKIQTSYNGQYTAYYNALLRQSVQHVVSNYGLEYNHKITLPFHSSNTYEGIEYNGRKIILMPSYLLTTSSSQTEYAEDNVGNLYQSLRGHDDTILVNILDGAGWVGRSSDYRKVYNDCHYFLNLKTIDKLSEIIEHHFNITA